MKQLSGITLIDEREGEGRPAQKGDRIVYNTRLFLNQGDEVPLNRTQAGHLPQSMSRVEDGVTLIDHTIMLGRLQAMAGIDHARTGMKAGGYRKVRISPHLAYRDKGIPDMILPNAVLVCEIWLRHLERKEIL